LDGKQTMQSVRRGFAVLTAQAISYGNTKLQRVLTPYRNAML
jgi:hypothetical protein